MHKARNKESGYCFSAARPPGDLPHRPRHDPTWRKRENQSRRYHSEAVKCSASAKTKAKKEGVVIVASANQVTVPISWTSVSTFFPHKSKLFCFSALAVTLAWSPCPLIVPDHLCSWFVCVRSNKGSWLQGGSVLDWRYVSQWVCMPGLGLLNWSCWREISHMSTEGFGWLYLTTVRMAVTCAEVHALSDTTPLQSCIKIWNQIKD